MSIPRQSAMGGLKSETKQMGREIVAATTVLIEILMELEVYVYVLTNQCRYKLAPCSLNLRIHILIMDCEYVNVRT